MGLSREGYFDHYIGVWIAHRVGELTIAEIERLAKMSQEERAKATA